MEKVFKLPTTKKLNSILKIILRTFEETLKMLLKRGKRTLKNRKFGKNTIFSKYTVIP